MVTSTSLEGEEEEEVKEEVEEVGVDISTQKK